MLCQNTKGQNFQIKEKKEVYGVKNKRSKELVIPFEYEGIDRMLKYYYRQAV